MSSISVARAVLTHALDLQSSASPNSVSATAASIKASGDAWMSLSMSPRSPLASCPNRFARSGSPYLLAQTSNGCGVVCNTALTARSSREPEFCIQSLWLQTAAPAQGCSEQTPNSTSRLPRNAPRSHPHRMTRRRARDHRAHLATPNHDHSHSQDHHSSHRVLRRGECR